ERAGSPSECLRPPRDDCAGLDAGGECADFLLHLGAHRRPYGPLRQRDRERILEGRHRAGRAGRLRRLGRAPKGRSTLLAARLRYRTHRGPLTTMPVTPASDRNLIATPSSAGFLDRGARAASDVVWYWVAAEDVHGNIGPYSQFRIFTTGCQRGASLVMNNPAGPRLAPGPAPVVKPGDPPPPFLTSYGTSLDTTISDAAGMARVSYELSTGKLRAEASSSSRQKSVEVVSTDVYQLLGVDAGTTLTLEVRLELRVAQPDLCSKPPCDGGT